MVFLPKERFNSAFERDSKTRRGTKEERPRVLPRMDYPRVSRLLSLVKQKHPLEFTKMAAVAEIKLFGKW